MQQSSRVENIIFKIFLFTWPIIFWVLGLRCSIFIQFAVLLLTSVALLQTFHNGKYIISVWLIITWLSCLSLILHDLFDISFLSSGELFLPEWDFFNNVRWAIVISASLSSAIGVILPRTFIRGSLSYLTQLSTTRLKQKTAIFFLIVSFFLFYLVQINAPFLIFYRYAGSQFSILPKYLLLLIGALAIAAFLIGVIPILENRVKYGSWSRKDWIAFFILGCLLIILTLKGERAIPFLILTIFLLLWHANQKGWKYTIIIAIFSVLLLGWLVVFGRVRSFEGGIISADVWKHFLGSPFSVTSNGIRTIPSPIMYHMVECVSFWDTGFGRSGLSYINLLPQMIPTIVSHFIKFQRPLSDPELLGHLLTAQPGGIYVIAQAYWNFGMAGVFIFIIIMLPLLWIIEAKLMRSKFSGVIIALAVAGSIPKFMIYGIQLGIKNLIILIVIAIILNKFLYYKKSIIEKHPI